MAGWGAEMRQPADHEAALKVAKGVGPAPGGDGWLADLHNLARAYEELIGANRRAHDFVKRLAAESRDNTAIADSYAFCEYVTEARAIIS